MYKKYHTSLIKIFILYQFVFFSNCVEPVEPEFDLITGLVTVEAIISNEEESSFVKIQESELGLVFGLYKNYPINGADITFVNTNTSEIVNLLENDEANIYLPPSDFVAEVGDSWELDIKLADGRHYKSFPEKIKEPVVIEGIDAEYKQELEYSVESKRFISGHEINVSFNDPVEEENYYYWSYKSFETKTICQECVDSFYRGGYCNDFGVYPTPNQRDPFTITYECEVDCWRIRYNQNVEILEDEFINGSTVAQMPIANVLLHNKRDILVEVKQFSLSKPAYNYYKVLKDIVENNSGFNAPPPAALVGNMYNVNNSEEYVLGRFTAAATSKATIFLEREALQGTVADPVDLFFPESDSNPTPPGAPPVLYAPCVEGFYSTSIKPEGWQN
ncbi:DUF4249 domain-containing protein [Seonamhaeicola sp. MEBiC1930]|uniref:DUF4249 domain-containing protein n=1 Tax=Seonamhaeicola sp. MEBiC01930 TaxID=2976768 RepID=UPI00325481BA